MIMNHKVCLKDKQHSDLCNFSNCSFDSSAFSCFFLIAFGVNYFFVFFSSAELCLTAVLRTEHWGFFFLFHLVHTLWLIVISLPGQFTYLTAEALTTPTLLYCMSSSSNQHPHTYSIYNHLCHSKKHTQFYWVKVRIYACFFICNKFSFIQDHFMTTMIWTESMYPAWQHI